MVVNFRDFFKKSAMIGLLCSSFVASSYAENNQMKIRAEVYRCEKQDGTGPVYTSSPLQERGVNCQSLNAPKSALRKVSTEKFDKLSRARIAKLSGKKSERSLAASKAKNKGKAKVAKRLAEMQKPESAPLNSESSILDLDSSVRGH